LRCQYSSDPYAGSAVGTGATEEGRGGVQEGEEVEQGDERQEVEVHPAQDTPLAPVVPAVAPPLVVLGVLIPVGRREWAAAAIMVGVGVGVVDGVVRGLFVVVEQRRGPLFLLAVVHGHGGGDETVRSGQDDKNKRQQRCGGAPGSLSQVIR